MGATVWYRFTAPEAGAVSIDTFGSDFDTVLAVYRGSSLANLTEVACNDDAAGLESQVGFKTIAGTTYHVQVGGYDGETGRLTLTAKRSGAISGLVTSDDGEALSDVCVILYDEFEDEVASGSTGSDGRYLVPADPGSYLLEFFDCSDEGLWGGEWYDDQISAETADPVTVVGTQETSGIDASLAPASTISGTVVNAEGAPQPDVCVEAWESDADPDQDWSVGFGFTDEDGAYYVGGLRADNYKVQFYDCGEGMLAGEWFDDASSFGDATPIEVPPSSEVSGIDAELTEGGGIAGTVIGSEGAPIAYPCATAYDADGFYAASSWEVTDEGDYEIPGLHAGAYRVRFSDCNNEEHAPEWYDDKPDHASADEVSVSEGTITDGIDAQLGPGGAIEGRVTDPSGAPVPDVCVDAFDGAEDYVNGALTDEDGRYRIAGLTGDEVRILFEPCFDGELNSEWFNNKPDFASADPVPVLADMTVPGVDAALDAPGISVEESSGSTSVVEGGSGDTYTLRLTSAPQQPVEISVGDASGQVLAQPNAVVFTQADWDVARMISVEALNDDQQEGIHGATLDHTIATGDPYYAELDVRPVQVRIEDDDLVATTSRITYEGPAFGIRGQSVTLRAALTEDATGTPIAGVPVEFALGTYRGTGTTDATGRASVTTTLNQAPGSYALTASFPGAPANLPSSVQAPFEIRWERAFQDQGGGGTIFLNPSTKEFELVRGAFRSGIRSEPGMRVDAAGGLTVVSLRYSAGELLVNAEFELSTGRFSATGRTAGTDAFVFRSV